MLWGSSEYMEKWEIHLDFFHEKIKEIDSYIQWNEFIQDLQDFVDWDENFPRFEDLICRKQILSWLEYSCENKKYTIYDSDHTISNSELSMQEGMTVVYLEKEVLREYLQKYRKVYMKIIEK